MKVYLLKANLGCEGDILLGSSMDWDEMMKYIEDNKDELDFSSPDDFGNFIQEIDVGTFGSNLKCHYYDLTGKEIWKQ